MPERVAIANKTRAGAPYAASSRPLRLLLQGQVPVKRRSVDSFASRG